ncbi:MULTISPECIES: hypothetical protein [Brachybacterium]|uniref:Uncharacterized protein n=1 Tax=Brachybacterium kimchii TaxID=2942909 RepID=A0ABY4NB28_9MICO|nr:MULTISPECIES: hypothetical protein [Brachybacterium]MCG7309727.1 hypothetical protein [Brachybacterium sp. ACRRE]UQN30574.1 hypothetical protein M4486_04475 [Brachybacterium kimchii]
MTTTYEERSPVPAAQEPGPGAVTYAQVRRDAVTVSLDGAFVDERTPAGCFGIVVRNAGGVHTYWLRGAFGDPGARVVARTRVVDGELVHYVGGGLDGGRRETE